MKTLKITLLLLAVLLLTVSGQSGETIVKDDLTTVKKNKSSYDLLAHAKKLKSTLPPNG